MNYKLCAFADEADKSIDNQITALLVNGIKLIEIRGVDGENISKISLAKAKEVREKLDANGISVWSLGSPYGKIRITDDFAHHLDDFKYGLELCDILGAKRIRLFSFFVPKGEAEQYTDEVFERLDGFRRASMGSGIILCHENEKGIYGDIANRCVNIHKVFPDIKAVFDPANFVQCSQDTKDAWCMLEPYIEYMHIKDAFADGKVVPAGKGIGNIAWLLPRYKGEVLTLEPHLSVFKGLEALESGEKTKIDEYKYPSARVAFDVAVAALKKIIK